MRIDLRQFKQRRLLFPGASFTWRWHYGSSGESAGSIGVRVERDKLALMFNVNGTRADHAVELGRTACTFGGSRPWFLCCQCRQRCLVLYLRGALFRCRRCSGVAYASQAEDWIDRVWRRQQRIEARLGPHATRPKRMHHATFARLRAEVWDCEQQREDGIARVLARLGFAWL